MCFLLLRLWPPVWLPKSLQNRSKIALTRPRTPKTHSRSILELPKRLPRAPFWCPKSFRNWSKMALTRPKASPILISPGARLIILKQLQIWKFRQARQGTSRGKSLRTGKRSRWLRWGLLQKPKFKSGGSTLKRNRDWRKVVWHCRHQTLRKPHENV